MTDETGGTMCYQKLTIAEAPQHADARHAAGCCCGYVDIAVAHIDGMLTTNAQLSQGFVDSIGSGLLTDALSLVFTNSYLDGVWKKMLAELLGGSIELVADDCRTKSPLAAFP